MRVSTSPLIFLGAVLFDTVFVEAVLLGRIAAAFRARGRLNILVPVIVPQITVCNLQIQNLGLEILLLTVKLPFPLLELQLLFLELISFFDQCLDLVFQTSTTVEKVT